MKSRFIIFRFVLMYLLAISVAGCGGDDKTETEGLPPMEQLTGKYMLVEFNSRIRGTTISFEPPTVFGELELGSGGKKFSLTMVITDDVDPVGDDGKTLYDSWKIDVDSWDADEETLTHLKEHSDTEYNVFDYIFDEKYLTLETVDGNFMITMKWRKL